MIYTITLNPAIDHTIRLNDLEEITTDPLSLPQKEAAGKGINVSRVLKKIGVESVACTILGGPNGDFIIDQLQQQQIPMIVQRIHHNTRENKKVIAKQGLIKEYNEEGPSYELKYIQYLIDDLFNRTENGDIIVLSGSIPQNLPTNIYQEIIVECHKRNLSVVLDTSGSALASGILAKPDIIKPNMDELEQLAGQSLTTTKDIIKYAKTLLHKGVKEVIITMGDKGLLYISNNFIIQVQPIIVPVINTVGAGDSFVAGFVAMRDKKQSIQDCLSFATAVATASVMEQTTVLTDTSKIHTFQEAVIQQFLSI